MAVDWTGSMATSVPSTLTGRARGASRQPRAGTAGAAARVGGRPGVLGRRRGSMDPAVLGVDTAAALREGSAVSSSTGGTDRRSRQPPSSSSSTRSCGTWCTRRCSSGTASGSMPSPAEWLSAHRRAAQRVPGKDRRSPPPRRRRLGRPRSTRMLAGGRWIGSAASARRLLEAAVEIWAECRRDPPPRRCSPSLRRVLRTVTSTRRGRRQPAVGDGNE